MILHPEAGTGGAAAALSGYLQREALRCTGAAAPQHRIAAACDAVARYWLSELGGAHLGDGYALNLVARALHAAGEDEAARRLCAGAVEDPRLASSCEPFVRTGLFSPALYRLLASGCIRPSRWAALPGEIVWVVDATRLRTEGGELDLPIVQLAVARRLAGILARSWTPPGPRVLLAARVRGRRGEAAVDLVRHLRDALELEYRRRGVAAQCVTLGPRFAA